MEKQCWYRDWFDSPYYHLLYNKRDEIEADYFITRLANYLKLPAGARVWDNACGKGRHVLSLAKKGFVVTGTDLSEKSIAQAAALKEENAEFYVHDMRKPFRTNYFDCVLNLFTSIGYFERKEDNLRVFKNAWNALKPGGKFVVDFFNAEKIREAIVPETTEERGNISFNIRKEIKNNSVRKKIEFEHMNRAYCFEEKVSLLTLHDFEEFAAQSKFITEHTFGNYSLQPFEEKKSERLIMIFKK